MPKTITDAVNVGAFSLQPNEHLYVEYFRHQTVGMIAGGGIATMLVYDGANSSITHPAANGFPDVPALGSVAARVKTTPQLSAPFSDPDAADTGTLSFQLCSDPACAAVLQSGSSSTGLANGATGAWTPSISLVDGTTYYWRSQATDSVSNLSGWSATSSFVFDTTPPGSPTAVSPAAGARVNSSTLSATFVDSDATDSGTVDFQVCKNAPCSGSTPTATSTPAVYGGTVASVAPTLSGDGTYYWRSRATDVAGNQTAWTPNQSFVLDTNPPPTPAIVSPADGASLGNGSMLTATFSSSDAGDSGKINFQICTTSACTTVVANGSSASGLLTGQNGSWSLSSVANGSYYWRAQAQDAAGNTSTTPTQWSAARSFTLDATPPVVTPTSPAAGLNSNQIPTLNATYSDTHGGSLTFQVCPTSACSSVVASTTVSGLASSGSGTWTPPLGDGTYFWRVRGTDSFGNTSEWSAPRSYRFDGTPPAIPVLQDADGIRVQPAPLLSARVNDPGDSDDAVRILIEICGDSACTNVLASGYSGSVPVGSIAGLHAPSSPDGTYYWRAFAEDEVGNQSPWSATHSFVVDTVAPSVPAVVAPTEGVVVNRVRLSATFGGPDPTDRGTLEFQVCADADCASVVADGSSASVVAGAPGSWTAVETLDDGVYFWRVRAVDAAGNDSAWSPTRSFTLDQMPPGRPQDFRAHITGQLLTLRWRPPAGPKKIRGYALIVNGKKARTLDAKTRKVRIHLLKHDTRSFAVAAIDQAGNMSETTRTIATFKRPLSLKQARAATLRHP